MFSSFSCLLLVVFKCIIVVHGRIRCTTTVSLFMACCGFLTLLNRNTEKVHRIFHSFLSTISHPLCEHLEAIQLLLVNCDATERFMCSTCVRVSFGLLICIILHTLDFTLIFELCGNLNAPHFTHAPSEQLINSLLAFFHGDFAVSSATRCSGSITFDQ